MNGKFDAFREATARAVFESPGHTSTELRQQVSRGVAPPELSALVEKIRGRAYAVTDHDLDALRHLYSEDQLFEVVVAAAFGAATDRLDAARRAVEEA
jgi:alkylhydroperoxidase family enzyme